MEDQPQILIQSSQLMKEMWSARTDMKRDAREIVKTHYGLNFELAEPEMSRKRIDALIGNNVLLLGTYLCGGTVSRVLPMSSLIACLRLVYSLASLTSLRAPLSIRLLKR